MSRSCLVSQWVRPILVAGVISAVLVGCGGGGGGGIGVPSGNGGVVTTNPPSDTAYAKPPTTDITPISMSITNVTFPASGPIRPTVEFYVTIGAPTATAYIGLLPADVRLNIAKLTPAAGGKPANWQNYINSTRTSGAVTAVRGTTETPLSYQLYDAADPITPGALVDHGGGIYTYTFATDISDLSVTCPAPCKDADGNPLDTVYAPTLTHRVGIYTRSVVLSSNVVPRAVSVPQVNVVKDIRPSDGATTGLYSHDVVDTAKCNQCHNKLIAHGGRSEVKYCVTCHNPGSTDAATAKTVDFRVMIHKIHRGENLPPLPGPDGLIGTGDDIPYDYMIGSDSFADVAYPQDIRNCSKCHDGTGFGTVNAVPNATSEGDNWKSAAGLSIAACGSCHENIDFSKNAAPGYDWTTVPVDERTSHSGGPMSSSSTCNVCHKVGGAAGSVEEKHSYPTLLKTEAAKYSLGIVSITPTTQNSMPTITFKITNPTNADALYDIATTPAITGGSMSLIIGWNSTDINNSGRSNAQPISISLLSSGALASGVAKNLDGTYSVTSTTAIPNDATGSGVIGFYARMSVDVDGDGSNDPITVKSVVDYFPITDTVAVPRRRVVQISNCDQCHDTLSLHGGARTDEPQLCVVCHNPNATDTARRPVGAPAGTLDNKKEEAIDFKRLIHGIHSAGASTRVNGLVVYGYPGPNNPVDFSDVRFPGIVNDCKTCHASAENDPAYGSYELQGIWEAPSQNGILGSTIDHGASLTDPSDDLNISPTAAVCSACHDSDLVKSHMTDNGGLFSALQSTLLGNTESCANCHGPDKYMSVKVWHEVP